MEDELNQLLRALSQRDSGVEGDASTLLGLQEAKKQRKNILQIYSPLSLSNTRGSTE